jgi:hypothetical protein
MVGVALPPRSSTKKGTAVSKDYQKNAPMTTAGLRHVPPETVTVALSEIVENVQEGLLALAVGTGLQVMQAMMAEDVAAVCGPKGKHDPARTAVRHGTEAGSVTLGGPAGAGDPAAEACKRRLGRAARRPPTSCSPPPRCWAGWRWAGCWPACRPVATVIGRCQLYKIGNGADKLPDHLASTVTKRMRQAYHAESALAAGASSKPLAKELERAPIPARPRRCAKDWLRR